MNSALRRLREWIAARRGSPSSPDPAFVYRLGWSREVRTWDASRRAAVAEGLSAILASPDFVPNAYQRRYRLPALDANLHSGASLVSLRQVLAAFEDHP